MVKLIDSDGVKLRGDFHFFAAEVDAMNIRHRKLDVDGLIERLIQQIRQEVALNPAARLVLFVRQVNESDTPPIFPENSVVEINVAFKSRLRERLIEYGLDYVCDDQMKFVTVRQLASFEYFAIRVGKEIAQVAERLREVPEQDSIELIIRSDLTYDYFNRFSTLAYISAKPEYDRLLCKLAFDEGLVIDQELSGELERDGSRKLVFRRLNSENEL